MKNCHQTMLGSLLYAMHGQTFICKLTGQRQSVRPFGNHLTPTPTIQQNTIYGRALLSLPLFNYLSLLCTCIIFFIFRSGIENRPIFHKTVPRYSQDDSIVSYGHYDPLARKESCVHCCGDREREKNRLTVRSHSQLKNHSRNQHNCTENWNIFIHNSKMVRLIGKLFVIFIFMCLLGFIFGRSSSTIVSDSEKIHLGEEAKLTMVGFRFTL